MSRRQAAEHFKVGTSSAIRWVAQALTTGDIADKPRRRSALGCDRGRGRFHPFPARLRRGPHPARDALRPGGQGPIVQHRPLSSFFARRGIMLKKSAHAAEQERPDILKRRREWFETQLDRDPERLVFIDETWASTNIARSYGRAPRRAHQRSGFRSLDRAIPRPLPADRRCRRHGQFIQPQRSARQSAD